MILTFLSIIIHLFQIITKMIFLCRDQELRIDLWSYIRYVPDIYLDHRIQQPLPKLQIPYFYEF